jgi:hypothetical protein
MNFGLSTDLTLVIAGVCAVLLVAGIVATGTQVVRSAGKANDHLARAAVLGAATSAKPGAAPAIIDTTSSTNDTSHQVFALLNEYYAANISQGNTIFWASLLSMSIGFAIIFAGIVSAGANAATAILTTVAGVLTQFIAATFLVALRSTQQQSTTYAQNLMALRMRDVRAADDARAVALGLRLLGEIAGDGATALANTTRAALAMGLIANETTAAAAAPAPPAPVTDVSDASRAQPRAATRSRVESLILDETRGAGAEGVPDR